jgi:1,4-alpha-glucan branching enzyme
VSELNKLYKTSPCFYEYDFNWDGFEWIDLHDADNSILSFLRKGKDPQDKILVVLNLTPVPRPGYRLGVPQPGEYELVLNSDADAFGGSNYDNVQRVYSDPINWHGRENSILLQVPPLSALYYRLKR